MSQPNAVVLFAVARGIFSREGDVKWGGWLIGPGVIWSREGEAVVVWNGERCNGHRRRRRNVH